MMSSTVRKIFMSNKGSSLGANPNIMETVINIIEKNAEKIFMRGKSPTGLVTIKLTPMMSIKELKLHPEAIIDTENAPPEAMEYLRVFCNIVEKEVEKAYQNAQEKLLNKAASVSEEINHINDES